MDRDTTVGALLEDRVLAGELLHAHHREARERAARVHQEPDGDAGLLGLLEQLARERDHEANAREFDEAGDGERGRLESRRSVLLDFVLLTELKAIRTNNRG